MELSEQKVMDLVNQAARDHGLAGKVMVKQVRMNGDIVAVRMQLLGQVATAEAKGKLAAEVEKSLQAAGAGGVQLEWSLPPGGSGASGAAGATAATAATRASAPAQSNKAQEAAPTVLPQVKHVIAVGAGKGGVGKSTLAVNLAVALQRMGHKVGLMDGDIYGPSLPTMLGIKGRVPQLEGGKLIPMHVHGIHAVTIGSLVDADKPLIWRGPMAHGAFKQLLLDNTLWPELDFLIVDLPPGTGDVPLTLCQLLPLSGAVVVATPQRVALDDCVRAVRMFQQLSTPVLGIVENMSYFVAPDGTEHDIFGRGGAQTEAQELGIGYLGAVPMLTDLRRHSDGGDPTANFQIPALANAFEQIALQMLKQLQLNAKAAPTLNIT